MNLCTNAMKEKIAIYGGSFDPIHRGHIAVAKAALKEENLNHVYFVPAKDQPFKGVPTASAQARMEMISLAIREERAFSLCDFEIKKSGVSYSVETAAYFKEKFPNCALYFIMGEDSYFSLPRWHQAEKLLSMVTPLVVTRNGAQRRSIEENARFVAMPPVDISSTEIRARIHENLPLTGLVPEPVADFIKAKGLYKA